MSQITLKQLLSFSDVFPDEEMKETLEYLKDIHPIVIQHLPGMLSLGLKVFNPNTNEKQDPNFDYGFINNRHIQLDIIERVNKKFPNNKFGKPYVINPLSSLKLAEVILSNDLLPNDLIPKSDFEENDENDKNNVSYFKAYLTINEKLNERDRQIIKENELNKGVDLYADVSVIKLFPISDTGAAFENRLGHFYKLVYATFYKYELLLEFLNANSNFSTLLDDVINYFQQNSSQKLEFQVKNFLALLCSMTTGKDWVINVEEEETLRFFDSLTSQKIVKDEDFTPLKNYPLCKIDNGLYSIVHFFFAVDKFYKSLKFILKSSYNNTPNLKKEYGDFFNFYNTKFSEETLCKKVLDETFPDSIFVKRKTLKNKDNEPDYYARKGKTIFLFECKDVLIDKKVKSSSSFNTLGDLNKIEATLKKKILFDKNPVGIGQLVSHINKIVNKKFQFDDYVNENLDLEIYPILLVCDKIFDTPGLNYKLNQWYWDAINKRVGDNYNSNSIRSLTLIDINTFIYWLPYLTEKEDNFLSIINIHLAELDRKIDTSEISDIAELKKMYDNKIMPISLRLDFQPSVKTFFSRLMT